MGEELPAGPPRAAAPLGRRGLPVLAQPARRGLPPGQQHPRRPRHGREHHADGLRQPRRHLRDRRLLHPQPVHRAPRSCTASSCVNAQGEDVVAGIRTPRPLAEMESVLPEAYKQLLDTMTLLEQHYGDMQDIEFTVEQGTLYLLQTRNGKRTAQAAMKVVSDLVAEGVIDRRRGAAPGRARPARPAAAPGHRPQPRAGAADHGPERLARCGRRQPGLRRRHRRAARPGRRRRGAGALGDHPRRHPRRDRRAGRAHGARGHDLARGGGRPRHGQAVRGRRLLDQDRRRRARC